MALPIRQVELQVQLGDEVVGTGLSVSEWCFQWNQIGGRRSDLLRWREDVLATEARFRGYQEEDPDRHISGEWWSTPVATGIPATSRSREGLGAVELLLEEDDISDGARARVWSVRIDGTPRVYEIAGPETWAQLVDAFPLAVPASRRSDWYNTGGDTPMRNQLADPRRQNVIATSASSLTASPAGIDWDDPTVVLRTSSNGTTTVAGALAELAEWDQRAWTWIADECAMFGGLYLRERHPELVRRY
ncbi:MAG: hypothetical protein WAW17_24835 [Rhodococcus sp. (in: high G+C Gram-positive bacteria)]|uniref:hypothetical protein n=1 Tax=Rhodococcus sp. TaxID=1831 RepID=UPI003BAEB1B1